jgi:hypothetical protein
MPIPITITDLKDLYRSEPQKAMRELNKRIRHIEPHMIEIPGKISIQL